MTTSVNTTIAKSKRYIWAGIIGNILEHYDTALFGLLAPFLAPLFFPTFNPINALILTYAILPLNILSKPLGSLIFGKIGDRLGRKQALSISIFGTAIMTGLMGCVPDYNQAGLLAPVILAMARFMQKLFAAGECVGGAIFILEHHEKENKGFLGSLYSSSTVLGIIFASALITIFDSYDLIYTHWRWLFWVGFATSGIGFFIRNQITETPQFLEKAKTNKTSTLSVIQSHWKEFLAIIAVSGFTCATYEVALVFLNAFLPIVSQVSSSQVMGLNTALLVLDMALLPFFGWIFDQRYAAKHMFYASCVTFFTSIPLYIFCEGATLWSLVAVRMVWVILGVWFCAPFHAWAQGLVPMQHRYTILSLGYAIGSQLIGAPSASIGFWLFQQTELVWAPACYLMVAAFLAMCALWRSVKPQEVT